MRHRTITGHVISCILYSAAFCIALTNAANPLVPSTGAWVGVSVDWDTWTSANDYIKQAEFTPTSFSIYVRWPIASPRTCSRKELHSHRIALFA